MPAVWMTVAREDALPVASLDASELHSNKAEDTYRALLPWLDSLVLAWETYLMYGGFPRAVAAAKRGDVIPAAFVEDLYNVISSDAFRASRLSGATEMALLERLWSGMAAPANVTAIATDVSVTPASVDRHIEYLRDAYLLWSCPQRSENAWLPRPRAQQKLYAIDSLIARLPHLKNFHRQDVDPTVLTEMQLGVAIRRRLLTDTSSTLSDDFLFFERTPSRKEIDFVAEALGDVALEGKYISSGRWLGEAATLNASRYKGILATRNVLDTTQKGDAWAVPAGMIAYLLDT